MLEIQRPRIWARMHGRSIRTGTQGLALVLIEDLTAEKTELLLTRKQGDRLRRARDELEQRVAPFLTEAEKACVRAQAFFRQLIPALTYTVSNLSRPVPRGIHLGKFRSQKEYLGRVIHPDKKDDE